MTSNAVRTSVSTKRSDAEIPEALERYDSLGRFRDAFLAYEFNSETDPAKRKRLMEIIGSFSNCLPPFLE